MTSVTVRRIRLAAAATAFALWIAYLIYLSLTARNPVVLSRGQFLVSNVDVIAEVGSKESKTVKVLEVRWPRNDPDHLAGKEISVSNLPDCEGLAGPGQYILPLFGQGTTYRVAAVPRSPGYSGALHGRVYPDSPQTRGQLDEIHKAASK